MYLIGRTHGIHNVRNREEETTWSPLTHAGMSILIEKNIDMRLWKSVTDNKDKFGMDDLIDCSYGY